MKLVIRFVAYLLSLLIVSSIVLFTMAFIVHADSPVLKWNLMDTPGSTDWENDVVRSSEVNRFVTGYDGRTFFSVDIPYALNIDGAKALYKSEDGGLTWDDSTGKRLFQCMTFAEQANFHVWDVAIARDNVNIVAAVTNNESSPLPGNVWVSIDGGSNWLNTDCPAAAGISSIDMTGSTPKTFIAIGTRTGTGTGTIYILEASVVQNWVQQQFTQLQFR